MEGVAFAARRDLSALERRTGTIDSIVAAAGGARGVWLEVSLCGAKEDGSPLVH